VNGSPVPSRHISLIHDGPKGRPEPAPETRSRDGIDLLRQPNEIGVGVVKAWLAVGTFAAAIGLVLSLDLPISIGFLTGAVGMILGGVLTIEEAYRSIDWKVVFLIFGLIPIGIAMQESGAASLIAETLVGVAQGLHPFFILFVLGILMTIFSLIMSNVAATVLMVPLVLEMAGIGGLTPQVLVLQVGLCAANSFILPTHHVNALLMTPGGYRVQTICEREAFPRFSLSRLPPLCSTSCTCSFRSPFFQLRLNPFSIASRSILI